MIAAFAPEVLESDNAIPSRPAFSDARAQIEEIERLYTAGLSTYDIAEALTSALATWAEICGKSANATNGRPVARPR